MTNQKNNSKAGVREKTKKKKKYIFLTKESLHDIPTENVAK